MNIAIYVVAFIGTICIGLAGYLVSFGHHKTASIWVLFPALVAYALALCLYLQTQAIEGISSQADRINTPDKPTTDLNPAPPPEQKTEPIELVTKPDPDTLPPPRDQRQISGFLRNADKSLRKNKYGAAIEECNKALRLEPNNRKAQRLKQKIIDTMGILDEP